MDLNTALPAALAEKLKKHTELEPIYCMRTDIGNNGMFTKDCWLGATEKEIFIFLNKNQKERTFVLPLYLIQSCYTLFLL